MVSKRVLIVKDVAASAADLQTALEREGCTTEVAENTAQALGPIDAFPPIIILVALCFLA